MSRRKWIITGGAGFIGCHAAARFHAAGDHVVVVDRQRDVVEDHLVPVALPDVRQRQQAHIAPANSRRRARALSQSVNRASGTVMAMKKHETTTYGV